MKIYLVQLLLMFSISLISQNKKQDNLIIENYLKSLNALASDDFTDNFPIYSYNSGEVHYSPDKEFKVFTIQGEGCGASCSKIYVSYLYLKSGKIIELDDKFAAIKKIYPIKKGKYLIIDEDVQGGTSGGYTYSLQVFELLKNTINFIPFTNVNDERLKYHFDEEMKKLSVFSPWWYSTEASIEYDIIKCLIHYKFIDIERYSDKFKEIIGIDKIPADSDEALIVTGEFKLKNQVISDFNENYKIIKAEEE